MADWLVSLDTLVERRTGADPSVIGGKASRLVWLARNGFAVPKAWVIPVGAFAQALKDASPEIDLPKLLRNADEPENESRVAQAQKQILATPLPGKLVRELSDLWNAQKSVLPWGLAVRSSATCEDGTLVSMAGLAESRIGVRGSDALVNAVRHVWASIASGRALAYLAARGMREIEMAVILQRVVMADSAGVMFTRGPTRIATAERWINASLGLGAPVVDGATSPDVLRISLEGEVRHASIARKPTALIVGEKGIEAVATTEPDRPALDTNAVNDLAALANRIESLEDIGWDVEFALEGGKLWVLQARPITGEGYPEGGDRETVWSSANVGEALPGVATPMTWSVAGEFSETGFRRAFSTLGCSVPRNAKLVASVHGRFYLNLTQFMRIAAQVPFLSPKALIDLGGGAGGEELVSQVSDVSRKSFYAKFPLTAYRLVREQLRLDREVSAFEKVAEQWLVEHRALDLAVLTDDGIARRLRDVQRMLEECGVVMLTCGSSALASHLLLRRALERVAPEEADGIARRLATGVRDLESARPAMALRNIVNIARNEPAARDRLAQTDIVRVSELPDGPTRRALLEFMDLYGDRAVREVELSTPRWREDAKPVLAMIRIALRDDESHLRASLARAEGSANIEMAKLVPRLNAVEHSIVRQMVSRVQKSARLRERTRAWVTRILGMMREVILEADRRLSRSFPVASEIPNAFFLSIDELVHALRTRASDLSPLVHARRAEFARDRARPDPPGTFVGSPPPIVFSTTDGHSLAGLGASAGVVEGPARVLRGPDEIGELCPGEILVVHTTDIGWTPLFLVAAGVVTELGGPLSHAAVVARELGVPTVVNVEGATRSIRTGDRLRLDGDSGVVFVLQTESA